jgi:oxygen-independent coproporphyrinogen-3 oxidase
LAVKKSDVYIENISGNRSLQDLGLYIHIPFCVKKCNYCDFLSAPATKEAIQRYIKALLIEIESYDKSMDDYLVPTIFIGGGTPSYIAASYINEIMEAVFRIFPIDKKRLEATIEVNPGIIDIKKLEDYRRAGINRLSFGLQSVNDCELKQLGRIHTYEQFKENYYLARDVGYENINVDLISALPGQTIKLWEQTLNTVTDLKPEHISAYSLIIEEGTPFFNWYGKGSERRNDLPDEETDRLIYYKTKEILEANGYYRYEISNYAFKDYECRHNISYWTGTQYLGIGLGAASLFRGARYHNLMDISQYTSLWDEYRVTKKFPVGMKKDYEKLSLKRRIEEFMFLGLRMCSGISREKFYKEFDICMDTVYGDEIKRLSRDKLLVSEGDRLYLTAYGIDISNLVLSKFLLD